MKLLKSITNTLFLAVAIMTISSLNVSATAASKYTSSEESGRYPYARKDATAFLAIETMDNADGNSLYDDTKLRPMLFNASELPGIENSTNVSTYGDFSYIVENDCAIIIGCENTTSAIYVPDYIRGYPVVRIDEFAFEWCDAIPEIHIPDTVLEIENGAFRFCLNLEKIVLSEEHPTLCSENGILYTKDKKTLICFPANSSVRTSTLPVELESIAAFAFWGAQIESISLSENITNIGVGAFGCCSSLEYIAIDENNPYYKSEDGVLYNKECTKILCMPNAVVKDVLDTVDTIGAYSFCGSIQEIEYQFSNILIVEEYAFAYCENLISIKFDDALEEIGAGAFLNCYYVTEIDLSDGVSNIGEDTFWNCLYIEKIVLGPHIKTIPSGSFGYCLSLYEIELNDNISTIGQYAFFSCEFLEEVNLKSTINIGKGAFAYCVSLSQLHIPETTFLIGEYALYWCNILEQITVDDENVNYSSVDGNLFNKEKDSLIQYALWNKRESYRIPEGVKVIKKSAFENATHLTEIHIPKSVEKIEKNAFDWCDNLQYAYYNGTKSEYSNIEIQNNSYLERIQIIYNDGDNVGGDGDDEIIEVAKPILTVNNAIAHQGQVIDVVIDLTNNPGVALVGFTVNYDATVMTLKSATLGEIFTGDLDCNISAVPFVFNVYSGSENKLVSGKLVTLQFEIKDSCPVGDHFIELSDIELINIDESLVECEYTNGTIRVNNIIYGDVTGDGSVTRTDLLRFAKYFSGFDAEIDQSASDVNCDGQVDRADLLRLAKYFSGFEVVLGK